MSCHHDGIGGLIGTLCPALMIEMKAVVGVAVGDEQLLAGRHVACGFQKHAFRHPRRFLYQMYRCRYLLHLYVCAGEKKRGQGVEGRQRGSERARERETSYGC